MNDLRTSISEVLSVIPQYKTAAYQGNIDLIIQQSRNLLEIIGSMYIDMIQNIEIVHKFIPDADISILTSEIKAIIHAVDQRDGILFADLLFSVNKTLSVYLKVQQNFFTQKEEDANE